MQAIRTLTHGIERAHRQMRALQVIKCAELTQDTIKLYVCGYDATVPSWSARRTARIELSVQALATSEAAVA